MLPTEVLGVGVQPVIEKPDQLDVSVANADVSRRRNAEQRRKNMRHHRLIRTINT